MDDRLSQLESEVKSLSRAFTRIEERLDALENRVGAVPSAAPSAMAPVETAGAPSGSEVARSITFIGRTSIVLAGGYLLRSLTESGAVAPITGVTLGLAYSLFWLVMADRAGARTRALSAAFHGAAAALVAFPLLWETTVRFHLLSPPQGAGGLALVSAVAIAVAWRRRLRFFAWVTLSGAALTGLLLLVGTRDLFWFSLVLVLLSVATLWLSYHSAWLALRWIVAGVADLAVVLLTVGVFIGRGIVRPQDALLIQLTLFSVFLASVLTRMFKRRSNPDSFEVLQTATVTLIGYGGALSTAPAPLSAVLAGSGLAAGVASYLVSASSRYLSVPAALYVGGIGFLLFLLGGLAFPFEPTLFFALAAIALFWSGSRLHPAFHLHGAAFVLAAAITSGLLALALSAFAAPAEHAWPPFGMWILLSLAAATLAYILSPTLVANRWLFWTRFARLLHLAIVVAALGAIVLAAVVPMTSGRPGAGADAAILATVRTAVLGLSALVLGFLGRFDRFREASWLVYPLLVAGGIKLVVEDFPQGRAVTLFAGLALYGVALILAPRVARSSP